MRRSLALLPLLALAAACADQATTPDLGERAAPDGPQLSRAPYIVVLNEGMEPGAALPGTARAAVDGVAEAARVTPARVYQHVLAGFAAELSDAQVEVLRADPRVAYVEPDAPVELFLTQSPATWGIDRIDARDLPLSNSFTYVAGGVGVTAYVLDTGIRKAHVEFAGRADYIANGRGGDFVGDGRVNAEDCQGHGTHVAGTIGSTTYGVAKLVTIRSGRVVNCSGSGQTSMVISAMDWIAANGSKPAVVNMSLGYGNVQAVRDAAERLVAAGYVVVAAAGNGNIFGTPQNACSQAPAGAPNVLTVGATTSADNESSFSNYGTCVDILAPGSSILSTTYSSNTATATLSGTSMASPHVAGVAALYLALNPGATPAQVASALKANGTPNTINLHSRSRTYGTPNLFLFSNY
jgi:subtilisin family serine protease